MFKRLTLSSKQEKLNTIFLHGAPLCRILNSKQDQQGSAARYMIILARRGVFTVRKSQVACMTWMMGIVSVPQPLA